jgi:uncharacterized protein (DUF58 family)
VSVTVSQRSARVLLDTSVPECRFPTSISMGYRWAAQGNLTSESSISRICTCRDVQISISEARHMSLVRACPATSPINAFVGMAGFEMTRRRVHAKDLTRYYTARRATRQRHLPKCHVLGHLVLRSRSSSAALVASLQSCDQIEFAALHRRCTYS